MQRTYKEILQDLSAQQYVGVYLLSGIETYFIDLIAKRIEENDLDVVSGWRKNRKEEP